MAPPSAASSVPPPRTEGCLARSLADTLAEEPGLEAVTIDRTRQKISVATLGRTDAAKLTERISQKLTTAQTAAAESGCNLLAGKDDCTTCRQPLSEAERKKITIHTEGNATTIARAARPTRTTTRLNFSHRC